MKKEAYKIDTEKLNQLSISDLTGLIHLTKDYPFMSEEVKQIFVHELGERISEIIIEINP